MRQKLLFARQTMRSSHWDPSLGPAFSAWLRDEEHHLVASFPFHVDGLAEPSHQRNLPGILHRRHHRDPCRSSFSYAQDRESYAETINVPSLQERYLRQTTLEKPDNLFSQRWLTFRVRRDRYPAPSHQVSV